MWSVVTTWQFSLQASRRAANILAEGRSALDAAEQAIWTVESDPAVDSVGLGGFLNRDGELELDAAMMDGDTLRSGSVCAIKGYEHPISVARAVMEKTPHVLLAGEGAAQFARETGFQAVPANALITERAREIWENRRVEGHDTIGLVALDAGGRIVAATSTSGASMKLPGRVGDSPLIGSGFYAESGVGGCAATGLGEDIVKTCLSFRVVELMRGGMSPRGAAETAVLHAHNAILKRGNQPNKIAIVCMNEQGECGAACNHRGFSYACANESLEPTVMEVVPVIDCNA